MPGMWTISHFLINRNISADITVYDSGWLASTATTTHTMLYWCDIDGSVKECIADGFFGLLFPLRTPALSLSLFWSMFFFDDRDFPFENIQPCARPPMMQCKRTRCQLAVAKHHSKVYTSSVYNALASRSWTKTFGDKMCHCLNLVTGFRENHILFECCNDGSGWPVTFVIPMGDSGAQCQCVRTKHLCTSNAKWRDLYRW